MKAWFAPLAALALTACGYGWEKEAPRAPTATSSQDGGAVVQGAARVAGDGEYIVQPGDTLYAIGFRNQIDFNDLAAWNGIGSDYLIRPGQLLRLTPPSGAAGVQARPLPVAQGPASAPKPIAPGPVNQPGPVNLPGPVTAPPVPPVVPGTVPVPVVSTPSATAPAAPKPIARPPTALRFAWPTRGEVIKTYNVALGSKGIDIAGEVGQPVQAVAPGKVVYSGSALKGYGELVIVKHDDTYLSAYGHNRRRLVKEGEEVRAGQTIAELGIGPEQKPILHFEIRENGKPVDPMGYLPPR